MIQWATARPVAYEFTTSSFHSITFTKAATNSLQRGAQAGSSYTSYQGTINQNGTTDGVTVVNGFSHTFEHPSIIDSTSSSVATASVVATSSAANSHIVTTTATTTMERAVAGTAAETYDFGTSWTTSTFTTWSGDDTTELTTFSTFATSYITFGEGDVSTVTATTETTITNGETALGNVFDTIVRDSNRIFIGHANAATDYCSIYAAASDLASTTGTEVTLSHQVGTVPISLVDLTETSSETLSPPASSEAFTVQYLANSSVTIIDNVDPTRLPNSTIQRAMAIQAAGQSETTANQMIAPGGVGLSRLTVSQTTIFGSNYTYSNFVRNPVLAVAPTFSDIAYRAISSTVSGFYPHVQQTYSTTFADSIYGPSTSQTIINQGGGQTTAATKEIAEIGYNQRFEEADLYEAGAADGYTTIFPACAVYKPYGVYVEDELFLAASLTGTTLTGVEVAALSRGGIYSTAYETALEFAGKANQANRFLLSYPDQSNDSFTINGRFVTYTATTEVQGGTSTTTKEETMVGTMPAQTGYIGDRRWFGGSPEESATYYESIVRGVYVDQNRQTSFFSGGCTSYAGETRPLKIWQPVLAVGARLARGLVENRPAFPGATYCFLAP